MNFTAFFHLFQSIHMTKAHGQLCLCAFLYFLMCPVRRCLEYRAASGYCLFSVPYSPQLCRKARTSLSYSVRAITIDRAWSAFSKRCSSLLEFTHALCSISLWVYGIKLSLFPCIRQIGTFFLAPPQSGRRIPRHSRIFASRGGAESARSGQWECADCALTTGQKAACCPRRDSPRSQNPASRT